MTKRQFEERYAQQSRISVAELRRLGRRAYPCRCGDDQCEGWQSMNPALYWGDRRMRASRWQRGWMRLVELYWQWHQGSAERRRRRILREINR